MANQVQRQLATNTASNLPMVARPGASAETTPWQFWALHVAAVVLLLPVVSATRLLPAHWHEHRGESIFAETNRTVLTALGTAFML